MRRNLLLLLVCAAIPLAAQSSTELVAASSSRLVLEGSSNVTDWRCSGTTIEARMEVAAPIDKINEVIDRVQDGNIGPYMANPAAARFPVPEFRMRIPVETLRCGNRQMERDMTRALKSESFPSIEFHFLDLLGTVTHDIDTHDYSATIAGRLSLAGQSRRIDVRIVAQRLGRDRFRLRAELPLRMTDFAIQPPTALFGMIKARDDLRVRFDLVLETKENGS